VRPPFARLRLGRSLSLSHYRKTDAHQNARARTHTCSRARAHTRSHARTCAWTHANTHTRTLGPPSRPSRAPSSILRISHAQARTHACSLVRSPCGHPDRPIGAHADRRRSRERPPRRIASRHRPRRCVAHRSAARRSRSARSVRRWLHAAPSAHGTGLTPTTSTPGLGSVLPHLHLDWAHPRRTCAGTGLTPTTSTPGLGSFPPHLHRDWKWPGAQGIELPAEDEMKAPQLTDSSDVLTHGVSPSPGADSESSGEPSLSGDVARLSPSPGSDVAAGSRAPVQMWAG
jgi:hypothetical protein